MIATNDVYTQLIEIHLADQVLRYVNNNENITYNNETYNHDAIELAAMSQGSILSRKTLVLRFSDIDHTLLQSIQAFFSSTGSKKAKVIISNVVINDALEVTKIADALFYIDTIRTVQQGIEITVKTSSISTETLPANKLLKDYCRFEFGSTRCGYTAQEGERCDKSLEVCKLLGNDQNFGGFPMVGGE